jgi:large conductance mechanosensitive channel
VKGFRQFLMRGNVVDLAVAVVVGAAFTQVVNALVKDMLTPLIGAVAGKGAFFNLSFHIHHSTFLYGDLINQLLAFVLTAATVYFVVVLPLNTLAERRARGQVPPQRDPVLTDEARLLTEIRDLLAARRPAGS